MQQIKQLTHHLPQRSYMFTVSRECTYWDQPNKLSANISFFFYYHNYRYCWCLL